MRCLHHLPLFSNTSYTTKHCSGSALSVRVGCLSGRGDLHLLTVAGEYLAQLDVGELVPDRDLSIVVSSSHTSPLEERSWPSRSPLLRLRVRVADRRSAAARPKRTFVLPLPSRAWYLTLVVVPLLFGNGVFVPLELLNLLLMNIESFQLHSGPESTSFGFVLLWSVYSAPLPLQRFFIKEAKL